MVGKENELNRKTFIFMDASYLFQMAPIREFD